MLLTTNTMKKGLGGSKKPLIPVDGQHALTRKTVDQVNLDPEFHSLPRTTGGTTLHPGNDDVADDTDDVDDIPSTTVLFKGPRYFNTSEMNFINKDYFLAHALYVEYDRPFTPPCPPKMKQKKKVVTYKMTREEAVAQMRELLIESLHNPKDDLLNAKLLIGDWWSDDSLSLSDSDSESEFEEPEPEWEDFFLPLQEKYEENQAAFKKYLLGPHFSKTTGRPFWFHPVTGEKKGAPPTPPFIQKLRIDTDKSWATRLNKFHESEMKLKAELFVALQESKAEAKALKPKEEEPPKTIIYPFKYDSELVHVLGEESAKKTTKKQRAKLRAVLKKRDKLLAFELGTIKQLKKSLLRRLKYFDSVADGYYTKLGEPKWEEPLKGEGLQSGDNELLFGDGLSLSLEGKDTNSASYGSKTSVTVRKRQKPRRSKKRHDITDTKTITSGYLADSDPEAVFPRLFHNTARLKQISTYHCLLNVRQQLLSDTSLVTNDQEVQTSGKPVEVLKDPEPTQSNADSEDEREFTDQDLQFLKEIRERHYINQGDCALTGAPVWDWENESPPSRIGKEIQRKMALEEEERRRNERIQDYKIAMSVFPRRGSGVYTDCEDPFDPKFWEGFCVNKYLLESNAGPVDPETGKPKFLDFLRYTFNVQRLEDAPPDDKSPEVLYYRLLPSQVGLKGVPDPEVPKSSSYRPAFADDFRTTSPVLVSSPDPYVCECMDLSQVPKTKPRTSVIKKGQTKMAEEKPNSGGTAVLGPYKKFMQTIHAFLENQRLEKELAVLEEKKRQDLAKELENQRIDSKILFLREVTADTNFTRRKKLESIDKTTQTTYSTTSGDDSYEKFRKQLSRKQLPKSLKYGRFRPLSSRRAKAKEAETVVQNESLLTLAKLAEMGRRENLYGIIQKDPMQITKDGHKEVGIGFSIYIDSRSVVHMNSSIHLMDLPISPDIAWCRSSGPHRPFSLHQKPKKSCLKKKKPKATTTTSKILKMKQLL